METISIVLESDIKAAERQKLLAKVREHPACKSVRSMDAATQVTESPSPLAARICHASCDDLDSATQLQKFIAQQAHVQSANIEGKRSYKSG